MDTRPDLGATLGPLVDAGRTIHESLQAVAALGCRGVAWPTSIPNLRPRDFDGSARRGLRETLRRHELLLDSVDAWVPPGHFLDSERVDRAIGAVEQAILFASDLAAAPSRRPVVSVLFPRPPSAEGSDARRLVDAVASLAAIAERHGIPLADHAVPEGATQPPTGQASSWTRSTSIGVDPATCLAAGIDPSSALLRAGTDRLALARLVDLFRSGLRGPIGEPGEARLDLAAYRATLAICGRAVPLVIDARQWRDPLGGIAATIERWAGELPGRSERTARMREPRRE